MLKHWKLLISAGVNLALLALLVVLARTVPQIYPLFYTAFSRRLLHFLGTVTSIVSFPLWELLLAAGIVWQLVALVRSFFRKRFLYWLCRLLLILSTLAFLFVGVWGLNFFGPSVGDAVGLQVGTYTKTQLKDALTYYAEQASVWSTRVARDAEGNVSLPGHDALSDGAVASYRALGAHWSRFSDPAPRVKQLLGSELFGHMGVTGVYLCLTGEASVSAATDAVSVPYTMCHELAHSLAYAGEDEANFAGFLACDASEDPLFRYSGYYSAFLYCYNALYRTDATAALKIWDSCSQELIRDCDAASAYYAQYDGAIQDAAQSVNDAYLRSFSQEGTASYGLVANHLIAWYLQLGG